MILQNWWYTSLLEIGKRMQPPLDSDVKADVLIIGGGAAGLAAALRLMDTGLKVVLLERNICGGSSTGKSAGFLTPDSELELAQLLRRFGPKDARDLWTTYSKNDITSSRVIDRVINSLKIRFPTIRHVNFIQYWPGRIDMTRDLLPTMLRDRSSPWIHFVLGCVGLPWATFCGDFVAKHVLNSTSTGTYANDGDEENKYYRYFSPSRKFLTPLGMEKVLGKRMVFTLNNAWAKYKQVNSGRGPAFAKEQW